MDRERSSSPAKGHRLGALVVALAIALGAALAVFIGLTVVLKLPNIPYNLRDLFPRRHPRLSMAAFSVLVVWVGAAPTLVSLLLLQRPKYTLFLPLWVTLVSLVSWIALRFAVTWESIQDLGIAGIPGWPQGLGEFTRFLALHGGIMLVLIVGHVFVLHLFRSGWRGGLKWVGLAAAAALPWWIAARMLAFDWRLASDNLNELIRHHPGHWLLGKPGHWILSAVVLLTGINGALLACVARHPRTLRIIAVALVTFVLMAPAWYLVNLGLEPNVAKYGQNFPALQFLLGANRSDLLSPGELLRRWSLVHLATVCMIACGGLSAQLLFGRCGESPTADGVGPEERIGAESAARADISGPESWRHGGVWCACLVVAYFLFLVYVHVHPLQPSGLSVGQALRQFGRSLRDPGPTWGPADMVSNMLLFIPFAFLISGAVTRENRRRLGLLSGGVVVVVALSVSLFIELIQEFILTRTSSLYDVVAQTIGTGIGITAWVLFGTGVSSRVRTIYRQPHKTFRILCAYVAVLFTFQMLYFDITISLTQLARKYRSGHVTVVPFADASSAGFFGLAYTAGLMVPVGFLLWVLLRRRRRPIVLALAYSFGVAASIELAQIFVKSRHCTSTDVVMGCIGALIGIAIARKVRRLTTDAASTETPG